MTIEKTSHTTNFVSDPLLRCYLYAHDRSTNEMRVSPLSLVLIWTFFVQKFVSNCLGNDSNDADDHETYGMCVCLF